MKRFLFISLLFALTGCWLLPNKERSKRSVYLAKLSASYEMISNHQLAWSRAELDLLYWTIVPGESEQKADLENFITQELPRMYAQVDSLASLIGPDIAIGLRGQMDTVVLGYTSIMTDLSTIEAYNNPEIVFLVRSRVFDSDGDCIIRFKMLNDLLIESKRRLHFKLIDDGE